MDEMIKQLEVVTDLIYSDLRNWGKPISEERRASLQRKLKLVDTVTGIYKDLAEKAEEQKATDEYFEILEAKLVGRKIRL